MSRSENWGSGYRKVLHVKPEHAMLRKSHIIVVTGGYVNVLHSLTPATTIFLTVIRGLIHLHEGSKQGISENWLEGQDQRSPLAPPTTSKQ